MKLKATMACGIAAAALTIAAGIASGPAAAEDVTLLPFFLPNICKKRVTAAFDSVTISSNGGVFLLAGADKRLDLIDALATLFPDHRDPAQISHSHRLIRPPYGYRRPRPVAADRSVGQAWECRSGSMVFAAERKI